MHRRTELRVQERSCDLATLFAYLNCSTNTWLRINSLFVHMPVELNFLSVTTESLIHSRSWGYWGSEKWNNLSRIPSYYNLTPFLSDLKTLSFPLSHSDFRTVILDLGHSMESTLTWFALHTNLLLCHMRSPHRAVLLSLQTLYYHSHFSDEGVEDWLHVLCQVELLILSLVYYSFHFPSLLPEHATKSNCPSWWPLVPYFSPRSLDHPIPWR